MAKTLEEKKIDKLYELLKDLQNEKDNEKIASLKWAIFELESIYCKEESYHSRDVFMDKMRL